AVIVGALDKYPMFAGLPSRRSGGSSIVYPIVIENCVVGVLTANRDEDRRAFDHHDLRALGTVASFALMAISNADLFRKLESASEHLRNEMAERTRIEAEL